MDLLLIFLVVGYPLTFIILCIAAVNSYHRGYEDGARDGQAHPYRRGPAPLYRTRV